MSQHEETLANMPPPDAKTGKVTPALPDAKTKPRKSLGRLEELACRIAAARGTAMPPLPQKAIVVMAADHGVAAEGVSAYPSEVTGQMLLNFAAGGAAINVLARQAGAELVVVGMGTRAAAGAASIVGRRSGPGTRRVARGR